MAFKTVKVIRVGVKMRTRQTSKPHRPRGCLAPRDPNKAAATRNKRLCKPYVAKTLIQAKVVSSGMEEQGRVVRKRTYHTRPFTDWAKVGTKGADEASTSTTDQAATRAVCAEPVPARKVERRKAHHTRPFTDWGEWVARQRAGSQEAEVVDEPSDEEPPAREEKVEMDHQVNISSEEEKSFEEAMAAVRRVVGERGLAVAMLGL